MNKLNQTAVGVAMRDVLVGLLIFAVTASAQGQTGISDHKIRSVRVESLQALLHKQNVTIRTKANQKIKGRFLRTDAEVIEVTHRFKSTSTRLPLREVETIEYRKVPAWMGRTAIVLMFGGILGVLGGQRHDSVGYIGLGSMGGALALVIVAPMIPKTTIRIDPSTIPPSHGVNDLD
jgi:hypothetical protein